MLLRAFMRKKLAASQSVLEGLALPIILRSRIKSTLRRRTRLSNTIC